MLFVVKWQPYGNLASNDVFFGIDISEACTACIISFSLGSTSRLLLVKLSPLVGPLSLLSRLLPWMSVLLFACLTHTHTHARTHKFKVRGELKDRSRVCVCVYEYGSHRNLVSIDNFVTFANTEVNWSHDH